jgi:hypothetical protein
MNAAERGVTVFTGALARVVVLLSRGVSMLLPEPRTGRTAGAEKFISRCYYVKDFTSNAFEGDLAWNG